MGEARPQEGRGSTLALSVCGQPHRWESFCLLGSDNCLKTAVISQLIMACTIDLATVFLVQLSEVMSGTKKLKLQQVSVNLNACL